ncbi:Auxin-responsive protein [Actinidia chinensis var. chinensis]|uniref:Auxin-responsive protein n=1 Tax=Actinidia chinensis var. chinensis TaxID=1590841 RepID=A0A2R6R727_ACTCC|nr:Auxin-responsive protein [Actinidia chinensis var. chinensis]
MISYERLIKMARKWRKLAAISRKRITFLRTKGVVDAESSNISTVDKGHFVVYTADQRRFVIPLFYLNNDIFIELLKMAEEEYGLQSDAPITLPCDAVFMKYAVSLIGRQVDKDLEKALLLSITRGRCLSSSYLQRGQTHQQLPICSF